MKWMRQIGTLLQANFVSKCTESLVMQYPDSDYSLFEVNCDWRYVFCNTLGIIPFAWQSVEEDERTHCAVAKAFFLRSVEDIWLGKIMLVDETRAFDCSHVRVCSMQCKSAPLEQQ